MLRFDEHTLARFNGQSVPARSLDAITRVAKDRFGSTRAIGPSRHRKGKPGAGAWRRQRMLAVVSPTSARSPNIAPGSPDHSSSRIASGCSMRGTNGDHRQPVQRQRAGAPSDRQPLQHLWRQIGQPQESANEGLGDGHGDRGALIVATSPRSNHHRQSQARDDAQQVWVWRRSVRRLIDLRRLSLGRPNDTALWRVLLLPWIGQWILAGIRSCGQAPRLSRKRACHDDASVQQGQVDNPGATSAPVHLTSCRGTTARNMRDNAPPNERRVRQTAQRAGPAWANTAKCCEQ